MAIPKPTDKQRRAAANLAAGMPRTEALIAAGYSEKHSVKNGYAIAKSPGVRCVVYETARQVAARPQLSASEQEWFTRNSLLEAAVVESGANKLRALELVGKDKRVGMFQPDVIVGVQVNLDAVSEVDRGALSEPLPEVDD